MKRRDFFSTIQRQKTPEVLFDSRKIDRPLASITPKSTPLTRREAIHFLRRACFKPTNENVNAITGKTADEAFYTIFGDGTEPIVDSPEDEWATAVEENPLEQIPDIRYPIEARLKRRYNQFIDWWTELMKNETLPYMEKLTLFWSTVWTIEFTYDTEALIPPPLLLANNQVLRQFRLGNYKDLALGVTMSGAMLLYQSLYYSSGHKPNENYMRELMELFTMGIGNYTEGDIRQGSLVLTGWRTAPYYGDPGLKGYFKTYFLPSAHDIGAKTFMGETIPARDQSSNTEDQVLNEEVKVLLNIMFTKRAEAISKFVANKVFRYFVYSNPGADDEGMIEELATVFRNNNFDILPMFKALFTSEYFYDEKNFGIQIKTPPEYIVTFQNQLGVSYGNTRNAIFDVEQVLYDPPDVGSWAGYRAWINTRTYPLRIKYANDILAKASDNHLADLAKKFTNYDNANELTKALCEYFLPIELEQERYDRYKTTMLNAANTDENGWSDTINNNPTNAGKGIRATISEIIKAPDFQLC
jgi:uncharacterized protein (DUF1800 family)